MKSQSPRVTEPHARLTLKVVPLVLMLASATTHAHTYCISTGDITSLKAALADAANNGENDVIELQGGHYSMASNDLLNYNQSTTDHGNLSIEGGYGPNIGGPCDTVPAVPDASVTVLEGGRWRARLADGSGTFALTALTIENSFGTDPLHPPIEIIGGTNSTGQISIENMIFNNNASTAAAAIYAVSGDGGLLVQNALFASNVSSSTIFSPIVLGSASIGSSLCALVANSTFVDNNSNLQAVEIATPDCPALVANNIFWNNEPSGVIFDNPQTAIFSTSDLSDLSEAAGTQASNLVSIDPLFNTDYSLQDFSPLRDKGSLGALFSPGDFDVIGQARTYHNELPDIGAFEIQDVIFAHNFDFQLPF